ncbi:MAG TPA: hypothetical protein PK859_13100 [Spirochaetota bacterium]|nr:hypothetical protein [Spirochaetota bacterium]
MIKVEKNEPLSLSEFVKMKINLPQVNIFYKTPFSLENEGEFVNTWVSQFARISFFTQSRGIGDFSDQSIIDVYVPATECGAVPVRNEEQPYAWKGKINGFAADQAIWYAFDMLTESEAREFMAQHRPTVIFKYLLNNKFHELTVKYHSGCWMVIEADE